jgi:hypothetical protein
MSVMFLLSTGDVAELLHGFSGSLWVGFIGLGCFVCVVASATEKNFGTLKFADFTLIPKDSNRTFGPGIFLGVLVVFDSQVAEGEMVAAVAKSDQNAGKSDLVVFGPRKLMVDG